MSEEKTPWSTKVELLRLMWDRPMISEYRFFMLEMIKHYLSFNPEWYVLDAGCGNGLLFKYLPEEFRRRYHGIDFTPEMIEYCKIIYPEYKDQFWICDIRNIYNIPYSELVITQNVLQHILVYQRALENLITHTEKIIMLCERTHNDCSIRVGAARPDKGYTVLVDRNPERWRFNENDFLDTLEYLGKIYGFNKPEVIGRPKSTDNLENVLAIYRMKKKIGD